MQIEWTEQALSDLSEIEHYIEQERPRAHNVWRRTCGRAWSIWRSFRTWASPAAGPEQGLLSSLLL